MNKKWYWAKGNCPAADWELASWQLFEAGADSLEEITENDELSTQEEMGEIVLFRTCSSDREFIAKLPEAFPQFQFVIGEEDDCDWDHYWRNQQKPVEVCEGLWIRPPWVDFSHETAVVLQLEAKMAFGTGEHASTRMTAQLMDELDLENEHILDIGTGTGILAMYALKKKAKRVVFTEIDPLTVPCIAENYQLNDLGQPEGILGGLECFVGNNLFSVILCNMIRTEFWPLREEMLRLLTPGGHILLSGQLVKDRHYLEKWAEEANLAIVHEKSENEWLAVSLRYAP